MNLRGEVALTIEAIDLKILTAEEYYQSLEPLVFNRDTNGDLIKLKKDNDAESFVRKFFNKFYLEYRTTYQESGNTYAYIDARRSIGDVYRIAYCYLGSKITLRDIIIHTYNMVLNKQLTGNYCRQINKRVYKNRPDKNGTYFDSSYPDELGLTKAHYDLLIKTI